MDLPGEVVNLSGCALCGASIVLHEDPALSWMGQFTAVYAMRDSTIATISGPGYCEAFERFIHPGYDDEESEQILLNFNPSPGSWRGTAADELTLYHVFGPCDSWGYHFHSDCWKGLLHIRGQRAINPQHLFDLLRSFGTSIGLLEFGHDYGGLWKYSVAGLNLGINEYPAKHLTWLDPHGISWRDRQWFKLSDLPIMANYTDMDLDFDTTSVDIQTRELKKDDIFSKLPAEIYQQIIQYLPLQGVFRLQLASRACYIFDLDLLFWKSRLEIGQELDFIFRTDLPHSFLAGSAKSWKSLCRYIWSVAGDDAALKNRRRVLRLGKSLKALLDRAEMSSCAGIAIQSTFEPNAFPDTNAWVTAYDYRRSQRASHYPGSTPMFLRMAEIPSEAVNIYVSIVEFSGHTHITGIRMETEDGRIQTTIGYVVPKDEHLLTTESIRIAGFMVVADHYAISGAAVISTSGIVSRWIGAHEGFAKRRLVLDSSANPKAIKYIKGSFDAYKLYCLSISDGSSLDKDLSSILDMRDRILWFPDVPSTRLFCTALEQWLEPQAYRWPATMALLGDINGQYKQHDVQITVACSEDVEPLHVSAIEISSCNGTHRSLLGRYSYFDNVRVLISVIHYADGERIIGLTTFYDNYRRFSGFTIHTNFKRDISSFKQANVETAPAPEWTAKRCFPERKDIMGFYTQSSPTNGLYGLGLVYTE